MSALQKALAIRHSIIESEINRILAPLNEQKSNLSLSINALTVLSKTIKDNTIKYQRDIEHHFNNIIQQIQHKKQQLFNQISLIETRKLAKINARHQLLIKCQQTVTDSITACNSIKNGDLKIPDKKQKLQTITDNTLDKLELPSKLDVKPNTQTINNLRESNVSSFISSLYQISDDVLQPLPIITNMKCDTVSHETATIYWNAELSSNNTQSAYNPNLYMKLNMSAEITDEKQMDNIVLFEANKKEYTYELKQLKANQKYNVNIHFMETDGLSNERLQRTDGKPVSITFQTKQTKIFEFRPGNETMKVSNDGLSVTGYGQLRFGEYLKAKNKGIYKVVFNTENVSPSACGIGFATVGFINSHNNHRMVVYGNKKVLLAKEFKNGKRASDIFWNKGDDVIIEINMRQKQGFMYRKFKNDGGIDHVNLFYQIDLPDLAAICVRFAANMNQTLTVVHQTFSS